jgi:LPXTG-site transpeptidase (sortase) family protein
MSAETQVAPKPPVDRSGANPDAPVAKPAVPARTPNRRLQALGNILTVLGVMLLTFVITISVIGQLQFTRNQKTLYDDFRGQLANATAPVGQVDANNNFVAMGAPVSLLTIPRLHDQYVVVEGTTSDALMAGPGHRRDTVLPGQAGTSIIFGRRAAYGGAFAPLMKLHKGDLIVATTGQGRSTYRVTEISTSGKKTVPTAAAGHLTLVTADGSPYMPQGVVVVNADLTSKVFDRGPMYMSYVNLLPAERAMQGQTSNWVAVLLLAQGLLLATVGIVWLYFRQGRLVAWVIGLPILLALGIALSNQIAGLLPNLM